MREIKNQSCFRRGLRSALYELQSSSILLLGNVIRCCSRQPSRTGACPAAKCTLGNCTVGCVLVYVNSDRNIRGSHLNKLGREEMLISGKIRISVPTAY